MKILDHAPHLTSDDRAAAYERVRSERVALRQALLARDSAGYRAAIPSFDGDDTALARADLDADPRLKAINAIATPSERRAFDRAVLRSVEANLWILPAVRERLANSLRRYSDEEQFEALLLVGLEDALGTWDPGRGTLTGHAYRRAYSAIRSYHKQTMRGRGDYEQIRQIRIKKGIRRGAGTHLEADGDCPAPDAASDPILRERITWAWDRLSNAEQEVFPLLVNGAQGPEIAERLGLTIWAVRRAVRRIRTKFAPCGVALGLREAERFAPRPPLGEEIADPRPPLRSAVAA